MVVRVTDSYCGCHGYWKVLWLSRLLKVTVVVKVTDSYCDCHGYWKVLWLSRLLKVTVVVKVTESYCGCQLIRLLSTIPSLGIYAYLQYMYVYMQYLLIYVTIAYIPYARRWAIVIGDSSPRLRVSGVCGCLWGSVKSMLSEMGRSIENRTHKLS